MRISCGIHVTARGCPVKPGTFCKGHGGLFRAGSCTVSDNFYNRLPTAELSALCSAGPKKLTKGQMMQVKFIEFRGAQIGLIEIKGCPHGVIKYGSDQVGVCSVSEHNRKAMWATDGKLGIKLISKRNALLCVMIEATKFVCRGRKWRDEYIDFPLDWDWFCPPDGELTAFLDESALITLKQINSAEVVDGVWLSQPTHSIVPLDDSRGECIKEIHNRRNDANPTRGLSMSYGGGFANGRGCFAELEGHPILSKLNPDLQFIIRHCTNSNGKNPDWVIENVIPYLVLTSRL